MKIVRIALFIAITLALVTALVFQVVAAPADTADFEIEGNTAQDDVRYDDWETVILGGDPDWDAGPGFLIRDGSAGPKAVIDELNIFAKGGKFGVPEEWTIEPGNTPAQNDLTNVYVYPVLPNGGGGDTWMVMGMERIKKQGTFDLDFEYNQVPWDGTSGTLVRTEGDVSIGFELSGNPEDPQADLAVIILIYEPSNASCTGRAEVYGEGWCVVFRGAGDALGAFGEATMNSVAFDQPPWGSFQSSGAPLPADEQVQPFFFAEAAINLTELGLEPGCPGFGSVHAKSRSSLEITADMKDLAGPVALPIECSISGYKYHDVNGDGTVPNDGDEPLEDWTIDLYDGSGHVASTTTNENGYYEFGGLSDGTYSVEEVCDSGWAQTYPAPSNGCGSGVHSGIVINVSDKDQGPYNFGNAQGSIIIRKEDGYGADLAGAGFTFDPDPFDGEGTLEILDGSADDQANGDDGVLCIDGVALDTYDVTETQVPNGYAGDPGTETVVVDSSSTCAGRLAGVYTADAVFTNELGSIIIRKEGKDYGAGENVLVSGAGFTFDPDPFDGEGTLEILDGGGYDKANGDDGILCIDDVLLDSYDVTETTVPANYGKDTSEKTVTVTSASTCQERLGGAYTPDATFVNDPLSEIVITFRSLNGSGVTVATSVKCTGPSADGSEQGPLNHDEYATFTDLVEGTYNCTIIIDP